MLAASLPLDLLVVALTPEPLDVLLAEALLRLTLLLKDLDGLVEGFDGRSLHLDLLREEEIACEGRAKCGTHTSACVVHWYRVVHLLGPRVMYS